MVRLLAKQGLFGLGEGEAKPLNLLWTQEGRIERFGLSLLAGHRTSRLSGKLARFGYEQNGGRGNCCAK
jgi:hypothetical protein